MHTRVLDDWFEPRPPIIKSLLLTPKPLYPRKEARCDFQNENANLGNLGNNSTSKIRNHISEVSTLSISIKL